MMRFLKQAALAAGLAGAAIGGLVTLNPPRTAPAPGDPASSLSTPEAAPNPAAPLSGSPRQLLPENAWLVVDFETSLAEHLPFEGSPDAECAKLPAPRRAALGLLPPTTPDDEPHLVLAALGVSPLFYRCARDQVLDSGGKEELLQRGIDYLESPTGILLHERLAEGGELLFVTARPPLEPLLRRLLLQPEHLPSSPHAPLVAGLPAESASLARATLVLPPDWLSSAGADAARSPLAALRTGLAVLHPTGALEVELGCDPQGCGALRTFAERAWNDFAADKNSPFGKATWSEAPGRILLKLQYVATGSWWRSLLP